MTAVLNDQYLRVMEVSELLSREADFIDRRDWKAWVDLYTPDSEFWMPAWRNEDETTQDPLKEISLIYLPDRGIEDRVFRFSSGDSYASTPLPTTSHCVGSIRVLSDDGEKLEASAKAIVATMDPRIGNVVRGVWYDYQLVRVEGALKIKRKKVTFLERVIDGTVDVYNV